MAKKNKKIISLNVKALDRNGKEEKLRTQSEILSKVRAFFEQVIKDHPNEAEVMKLKDVVNNALEFINSSSSRIRLYDSTEPSWVSDYTVPFDYHFNYLELPGSPGPLFEFVDTTNNNSMVFGIGEILRSYMDHFEIKESK